ncbi:hypothetical protein GCM10028812_49270 [Ancylobacter sonchi]
MSVGFVIRMAGLFRRRDQIQRIPGIAALACPGEGAFLNKVLQVARGRRSRVPVIAI